MPCGIGFPVEGFVSGHVIYRPGNPYHSPPEEGDAARESAALPREGGGAHEGTPDVPEEALAVTYDFGEIPRRAKVVWHPPASKVYSQSDDMHFTLYNMDTDWRPLDCPDRYRVFIYGVDNDAIHLAEMLGANGGKREIKVHAGTLAPGEYLLKVQLKAYVTESACA